MKYSKKIIVIFCVSLFSIVASAQTAGVQPSTFAAVEKGDVNQLKALLDAGANVNETYEGVTLLGKACGGVRKVNNDIIKVLLDSPKINVKALTYSYAAVGKVGGKNVSFSHKGEIVASQDTYTLKPEGQASATHIYKIVNGKLSVNGGRPLDKVK